jgi:endonuclease/exonuclease/phosphatase family metal-dependent hydrolase
MHRPAPGPIPHDPRRHLRLLSYNIQAGARTARYREYLTGSWQHVLPHPNKRRNLESVAELVAGFDIVALQEADSGSLRSGFSNQVQFLAELARFPWWSHQANRNVASLAASSNGLLSRMEPAEVVDHKLPGAIPGRGALAVHYGTPRQGLLVVIAHLALTAAARRAQCRYLAELIGDRPYAVLMGDLNCTASDPELRHLFHHTRLQPPPLSLETYPSWRPRRAIDHILATDGLGALAYEVPLLRVSDHLPVALTVALPDACRLD